MSLTEEQQKIYGEIMNSDKNSVISAPGGTGKTFLIKYIIKNNPDLNITVLAPTHKAKSLFTRENINCKTLARYLKGTIDYDNETGEEFFSFQKPTVVTEHLLIIDECSMVNSKMFNILQEIPIKKIFFGDTCQLPPINEKISPVFNTEPVLTLNRNMRTEKNPDSISAMLLENTRNYIIDDVGYINLSFVKRQKLDKNLDYFKKGEDAIILAWTNQEVRNYNKKIRKNIFCPDTNEEAEDYYVGEHLIFTGYRKTDEGIVYHTSDRLKIEEISENIESIKHVICSCNEKKKDIKINKCKKCGLRGTYNIEEQITFYNIKDEFGTNWKKPKTNLDKEKLYKIKSRMKENCLDKKDKNLWKEYYKFLNHYDANLNYVYSSTIHKAQGSEFKYVLIDIVSIIKNRNRFEMLRLLYTAVSRHRTQVIFIK